jgi:serine/threonine protein kinase
VIPEEIRLPDGVAIADLFADRRGSRVWKVTLHGGRTIALKYAEDNQDDQGIQTNARHLAAREAAVLGLLNHESRPYAAGVTERGTWLAVDWIEAPTLGQHWHGLRESIRTAQSSALFATYKAAKAIANLHAHCWRHADLQASHILVPEHGGAHLIDFALAQGPDQVVIEPAVTYRGALAHLTAPEVAAEILATSARHHIELTSQAEVYTFGAVVFTAWTQEWPYGYGATDPRQLTVPQIHARVCDPDGRRPMPHGWPQMAHLVSAMMDHEPTKRPTAAEVRSSLRDLMGGQR